MTTPIQEVDHPEAHRARVGAWNNFVLDPNAVDVIGANVLQPLLLDTKFIILRGLLQMLQHKGLYLGLASKDLYNYFIMICSFARA